MIISKGMIIKVKLNNGWFAHGRVSSVDENGDGKALFVLGNRSNIIEAEFVHEMVVEAFWFEGKGRYGI